MDELLWEVLNEHRLPWKVERDWSWEVIAADGHLVAQFLEYEDAIQFVEEVKRKHAHRESEYQKMCKKYGVT